MTQEQVQLLRQAKAAQLAGRTADALALLRAGLARFPQDLQLASLASSLLVKANQLPEARRVLEAAMAHHPRHAPLAVAAAMLELRRGDAQQARRVVAQALRRTPGNAALHQVRCVRGPGRGGRRRVGWAVLASAARASECTFKACLRSAHGHGHTRTRGQGQEHGVLIQMGPCT